MNKSLIEWLQSNSPDVRLVMASKYLTHAEAFEPFLAAGIDHFGENRVDALLEKQAWFSQKKIHWHFIGTLQTKKVRMVINQIDVLHALDRMKLAQEIEKHRSGVLPCYIQVNISEEPQKHGVALDDVAGFVDAVSSFKHLQVVGLMGMAEDTEDEAIIRKQFLHLKTLRDQIRIDHPHVQGLSMGMTHDYHIALKLGTTVLRLGRILLAGESYGT